VADKREVSRLERIRQVVVALPMIGLVSLLAAAMALGTAGVESLLASVTATPTSKVVGLALLLVVGVYYAVLAMTRDPLWPVRKRLWQDGHLWMARDGEDAAEPLVWDSRQVPKGTDVTADLDL
jgi:hypothetical protein